MGGFMKKKTFKLCYIEDNGSLKIAFFSQKNPSSVIGSDWDDRPYDCNAGRPYTSTNPKDEIIEVVFQSSYDTPADLANCNSNYSVDMINKGFTPWLLARYGDTQASPIFAGISIEDFIKKIKKVHGKVYVEEK